MTDILSICLRNYVFFFRVWHAYIFEGLFDVNHDEASSLDLSTSPRSSGDLLEGPVQKLSSTA